ncbi:MAG: DUF2797 domain-containing protein [Bacterioplanes sp.]|nr:DUF2797 domain-containing protein [Bacterioplanes sp.]
MTEIRGRLSKMQASVDANGVVQYQWVVNEQPVLAMNELIGQRIQLQYHGSIICQHCHSNTKSSFAQGYCYRCFQRLAQCDRCMMSPELCHFHQGTCREPEWAERVCFNDHIVYLANSSSVKVGITRATQMPVRWLDQGASQALPIFRVKERRLSGLLEAILRTQVADKTNWRTLLKHDAPEIDLVAVQQRLWDDLAQPLNACIEQQSVGAITALSDCPVQQFIYPVQQYPVKISSLNLDKTAEVSGRLMGIKGQYLIFDVGVINVRKFSSYQVTLHF